MLFSVRPPPPTRCFCNPFKPPCRLDIPQTWKTFCRRDQARTDLRQRAEKGISRTKTVLPLSPRGSPILQERASAICSSHREYDHPLRANALQDLPHQPVPASGACSQQATRKLLRQRWESLVVWTTDQQHRNQARLSLVRSTLFSKRQIRHPPALSLHHLPCRYPHLTQGTVH